jgi:hypothetical protein
MGDRGRGREMTAPALPAAKKKNAPTAKSAPRDVKRKLISKGFFAFEPVSIDTVADEAAAYAEHARLLKSMTHRAMIITAMTVFFIFCIPLFRPVYRYYAINPQQQATPMIGLSMPNLTNRAILSWAANGVTEIMTVGFGDFETKLLAQKTRFTRDGWDAFVKAFLGQKIDESFRKHQLVLTTVPSDTPVIASQGENKSHVYEWHVQVPVIMTYATNNNVTRPERALIDLTIMRVPFDQNDSGIAIDTWKQKKQ